MIGPRKKRSIAKKHQRHSAWQFVKIRYWRDKLQTAWSEEGQCRRLSHRVCPKSGTYNGKKVMTIKQKKEKIIEA